MHTYHKIKDMLCEELEHIANKGELTAGSLDIVDKITHSIKSIDTIIAMEDYEDGHSEGMSYYGKRMRRGSSYDDKPSMMYNRRGYSRDDHREHLISRLEEMMKDATDEHTKSTIRKCIDELD